MVSSELAVHSAASPLGSAVSHKQRRTSVRMTGRTGVPGPQRRTKIVWMKKEQLARQLAKESGITAAAAADQVDRIVTDILKRVRKGQNASLPGLGTFRPGRNEEFRFDRSPPFGVDPIKPAKGSQ